jgi:hypothetical protein
MNVNSNREIKPWARSKGEWKALTQQTYTGRKLRQIIEMKPFFDAYAQDKAVGNENNISKWIMKELTVTAKRKYKRISGDSSSDQLAEVKASKKTQLLMKHLKAGHYDSPDHLLITIGTICKRFKSDAVRDLKPKVMEIRTVPLEIKLTTDEEGTRNFEILPESPHLIITPSSDPAIAAEESRLAQEKAKKVLVVIPESKPHNHMTRENSDLLDFLSASDLDLIQTLIASNGDRAEAAESLNSNADAMNRQIGRIADKFRDMRALVLDFRLPQRNREPIEHRRDLADRFTRFVDRIQRMTKGEFPQTFAHAFALCAENRSCSHGDVLYDKDEIIKHLLKLWRTQTTQ